jgi:hypothetical protein
MSDSTRESNFKRIEKLYADSFAAVSLEKSEDES